MFNTPIVSIIFVLLAAILGAAGQFIFQHGARAGKGNILAFAFNPWVIGGLFCYLVVMILFTSAFKAGGSVRVLYPIYASTFIWAAIIAATLQDQPIRLIHGVGMLLLVAGIFCMAW